jgi:hypothetical protein
VLASSLVLMKHPQNAWHYTTAAGLISIVSRHRLWATSAAYMNDRDEIRAGREALQKATREHEPPLEEWQLRQLSTLGINRAGDPHDLFLLCAALDGDALTLWRSYGVTSEAEYSIDFDPSMRLYPVQQNGAEAHPEPSPPDWESNALDYTEEGEQFRMYDPDEAFTFGGGWREVEYLKPSSTAAEVELEKVLKHLKKPAHDGRVMPFFLDYLAGPDPTATFKHPGFEDEAEVRATWTVRPWWRFVLYRPGRFGITPFIEVAASGRPESTDDRNRANFLQPDHIDHLPIRAVRIGPTRLGPEAERSLRALLDDNGYGHVKIERSSTPYR